MNQAVARSRSRRLPRRNHLESVGYRTDVLVGDADCG
jgi:hypothetical protein